MTPYVPVPDVDSLDWKPNLTLYTHLLHIVSLGAVMPKPVPGSEEFHVAGTNPNAVAMVLRSVRASTASAVSSTSTPNIHRRERRVVSDFSCATRSLVGNRRRLAATHR